MPFYWLATPKSNLGKSGWKFGESSAESRDSVLLLKSIATAAGLKIPFLFSTRTVFGKGRFIILKEVNRFMNALLSRR